MSRFLEMEPTSDAELFDMLHGLFGLGDYDEETQWFKHRMVEINKIKALRAKRRIPLAEFALAARYCYRRRIHVTGSWQVCGYIAEARRDAKRRAVSDLESRISEAAAQARALGEPDWAARLLGARGEHRATVLSAWEQR